MAPWIYFTYSLLCFRKSIFWLTYHNRATKQTHVTFFTSRKALNRQKGHLASQTPCMSLAFMVYNLAATWFNTEGQESARVSAEFGTTSWLIFVNGEWKHLGEEISSILEINYTRSILTVSIKGYLQFDLKSMCIVAPLYATLKRLKLPSVITEFKLQGRQRSLEFGASAIAYTNNGNQLFKMEDFRLETHRSASTSHVDIGIGSITSKTLACQIDNFVNLGHKSQLPYLTEKLRFRMKNLNFSTSNIKMEDSKQRHFVIQSKSFILSEPTLETILGILHNSIQRDENGDRFPLQVPSGNLWQTGCYLYNEVSTSNSSIENSNIPFSYLQHPWLHGKHTGGCNDGFLGNLLHDSAWSKDSNLVQSVLAAHRVRGEGLSCLQLPCPPSPLLGVQPYNHLKA